ncbi:aminoglycoside phosphotransferase family protein [Shimazuella sp. AN120528]|uniref:aminoglycoside phosphotransferase family protein n=1 Tax=Shimazuella soli TaxID=1892854 RepID=UPI001F0E5A10|nr:aminoglycoside phosphotransferase family protein [Shimazuella soli]MCH5584903.1 aminoglycoside phosphotransferase family protein [Shimazuella soli]
MTISNDYKNVAKRICAQIIGEKIQSIHPIIGNGTVNQVYRVETNTSLFIIRMNEAPNTLAIYEKEKWCMEQAKRKGVPGPDVLAIGNMEQVTYMVQTFIKGKNGKYSPWNKEMIWRKLGEYTKQIHSIPVNGFGEILFNPIHHTFAASTHEGFNGTWHGFIRYNINCLTEDDPLILFGVFSLEHTKIIKQKFEGLLQLNFAFGLTHGDLSLKNTIVDKKGNVTLLDWGCAEVHIIPYWELIQLLKSQVDIGAPNTEQMHAFLQGYGITASDFQTMLPTLNTLLLLDACDKLRWAIDCKPECIPSFAEYAKKIWQRHKNFR